MRLVAATGGLMLLLYAAYSESVNGALLAIAVLYFAVLFSTTAPGLGMMLLTTGRYIYFIGLLSVTRLAGDTTYTALYFLAVDVLILASVSRGRFRLAKVQRSPVFFVGICLFTVSVAIGWMRSGFDTESTYWVGCYVIFCLLPFIGSLFLTSLQVCSAARWMFWSVAGLALLFAFELLTGQAYSFNGRLNLAIGDVPEIGSLFIGSVMPIGIFTVLFLGKEISAAVGLHEQWAVTLLRFGFVLLFAAMLANTGQRSPIVALVFAAGAAVIIIPRLPIRLRLGVLLSAVVLLVCATLLENTRFSILSDLGAGDFSALSTDETVAMRLDYYRISLDTFRSSPVLGAGLGSFLAISTRLTGFPDRIPHDAFLEILAGQGLVGGVPMALVIIATVRAARRRLNGFAKPSEFGFCLISFLFVSWIYEMALISFTSSVFADTIFWFLMGGIWTIRPQVFSESSTSSPIVRLPSAERSLA